MFNGIGFKTRLFFFFFFFFFFFLLLLYASEPE